MNKSESKYFNTAIRFDQALLSLLEKKPFEYITMLFVRHGDNKIVAKKGIEAFDVED